MAEVEEPELPEEELLLCHTAVKVVSEEIVTLSLAFFVSVPSFQPLKVKPYLVAVGRVISVPLATFMSATSEPLNLTV